jgi:DNA invertase Pin-like site-specific DNA recombinase
MIEKSKPAAGLIPAARYIRMSGDHQERSPEQQAAELARLAQREGLEILQDFSDPAVCGDSGTDQRPGLAGLLQAVKTGRVKAVLVWHTNRLSRQDPMDALELYNVLRKAGCRLITCCEGRIDLDDFAKQLLLFVNQKASKDYLLELSAKVLRGKRQNAEGGNWNGGPVPYGFDRAEVDAAGNLVRRLEPNQPKSTIRGHRVRLVPVEDPQRLAAVRFAFQRFASADLSVRALAGELQTRAFPAPNGSGWSDAFVGKLLDNPIYCGGLRWNRVGRGKYHRLVEGEITRVDGDGKRPNDQADVIERDGTHQGIVPRKLFQAVQKKLAAGRHHPHARRAEYPLSGLMFCAHCGRPMHGKARQGQRVHGDYHYHQYICGSYGTESGCGHFTVSAARVAKWLVTALQAEFLGPGRVELVAEIKRQLRAGAKTSKADVRRLTARLADLDQQVGRLVKAIRTTDAPELVEELAAVRQQRQAVQEALQQATRYQAPRGPRPRSGRSSGSSGRLGGPSGRRGPSDPPGSVPAAGRQDHLHLGPGHVSKRPGALLAGGRRSGAAEPRISQRPGFVGWCHLRRSLGTSGCEGPLQSWSFGTRG